MANSRARNIVFICLFCLGCAPAAPVSAGMASPAVSSGQIVVLEKFESEFVPARDILVWLPEGYSDKRRYAVLYMQDGDMLFDSSNTWNGQEWGVDEVAAKLMESGVVRDFIVVGIPNAGADRHSEYFPQKPFESMSEEQQQAFYRLQRENGQAIFNSEVRSERYLRFLVEELKPAIDENYSVLTGADSTFVMGSSMGGLISVYAISEYPEVFGGAACLSTHWPGVFDSQDNPFPHTMRAYLRAHLPSPGSHRIWFDHGTEGLDAMYPDLQSQVDEVMRKRDFGGSNWKTFVDEGAGHNENAWRSRLEKPLVFLLQKPGSDALARVRSPDGKSGFFLTIDGFGQPRYSVYYDGERVIHESRFGMRFREQPAFDRGLRLIGTQSASHDETWEQPWGERRLVRDRHEELLLQFSDARNRRFDVRVRLFDDGLGFRYEVPEQEGLAGRVDIVDELTEFSLPAGSRAWWIPGRRYNRYEYIYNHGSLDSIETAHTPMTVRTAEGTHLSIHEAALVDYAGFVLDQRRPGVFQTNLTPWSDGIRVKTTAPFKTPWRTLQLSPDAAGLLNSSLILNLNEPNKLGDVSWVEPGKYVGIWWAMHIRERTWGSGPEHGATTEETMRYMDFAAKHGFDGVLVEGWNIGWDGDWFHNGDVFSFTETYPDFDLRAIARHGEKTGVRLIGHHETSGNVSNYAEQMAEAFDLYASAGVRQVKTGYVADGGDIKRVDENGMAHYEWHDGQFTVAEYLESVTEAAKRKISINTHEPIKDTGLRRTYPNWLSREGARGQEFNAWGNPPNPPEHTAILPYTRMLSGPMDFTPGIFNLTFNGLDSTQRVQTTLAKQLALYVVIYSPVQMVADLPENYAAHPDAFQFIVDVPADWEESIALDGEVGEFVVFARQERGADDWFVGALTNEEARTVKVKLGFLSPGRAYTAQIYRDGETADWKTNPYDVVFEERSVQYDDSIRLNLAAGGGAAIRFKAAEKQ